VCSDREHFPFLWSKGHALGGREERGRGWTEKGVMMTTVTAKQGQRMVWESRLS
jgi:hypothetical protein